MSKEIYDRWGDSISGFSTKETHRAIRRLEASFGSRGISGKNPCLMTVSVTEIKTVGVVGCRRIERDDLNLGLYHFQNDRVNRIKVNINIMTCLRAG